VSLAPAAGALMVPFVPCGIKKIVKPRDAACNHKYEFLSFVCMRKIKAEKLAT
jgi:hypothetical protein